MINNITTTNGIQIGDNTHHQDQSITLHSFKMMNANNKRPKNPIPGDVLLLLILC